MAKKRKFGSTKEDHRERARSAIRYARNDMKTFRRQLALDRCDLALKTLGNIEFYSGQSVAERRGTGKRKNLYNLIEINNKLANKVIMCFRINERTAVEAAKKGK